MSLSAAAKSVSTSTPAGTPRRLLTWCATLIALSAALVIGEGRSGARAAGEDAVDTALVMAVDISQSVDEERYRLQMEGIAQALEDADVVRVITSGPRRAILFTLIGWADRARVLLPWTWIASASDAAAVARMLRSLPVVAGEYTCLGRLMAYLADNTLNPVPVKADRVVVDISGDGPDNCTSVTYVDGLRDRLVKDGVTINGLPILEDGSEREIERWNRAPGSTQTEFPLPSESDARTLTLWYERHVMGGPGAFVITANGYEDFARAIRRKFILEVAAPGVLQRPELSLLARR
ncbi:MAG: DUF1194 domain-containing protein [Hyphomicrobiaceae bacterium]|nr:DUF1194 domain-containing protein [Hyphomicrobiaceae bacterium]